MNNFDESSSLSALIIEKMLSIHLNYFSMLVLNWNLETSDCILRWSSDFQHTFLHNIESSQVSIATSNDHLVFSKLFISFLKNFHFVVTLLSCLFSPEGRNVFLVVKADSTEIVFILWKTFFNPSNEFLLDNVISYSQRLEDFVVEWEERISIDLSCFWINKWRLKECTRVGRWMKWSQV